MLLVVDITIVLFTKGFQLEIFSSKFSVGGHRDRERHFSNYGPPIKSTQNVPYNQGHKAGCRLDAGICGDRTTEYGS